MGQHNTLFLGRVAGALALCIQVRDDATNSRRIRRWARLSAWALGKMQQAMRDQINGI